MARPSTHFTPKDLSLHSSNRFRPRPSVVLLEDVHIVLLLELTRHVQDSSGGAVTICPLSKHRLLFNQLCEPQGGLGQRVEAAPYANHVRETSSLEDRGHD